MKYWLCTFLVAGPGGWADTAPTDPRVTSPARARGKKRMKAEMLKAIDRSRRRGRVEAIAVDVRRNMAAVNLLGYQPEVMM
eukprot:4064224-Pyramimonas_sp.AAC.1